MYQVRFNYAMDSATPHWRYYLSDNGTDCLKKASDEYTSCCKVYSDKTVQLVKISNYPLLDNGDDEPIWVVHSIIKYREPT